MGILGLAGVVFGILALVFGGDSFTLRVPHGRVGDGQLFGLLTNGWTDLLFIAAGALLILAAPAHLLAKSGAVVVAAVLGAAALVGVIRGNGVFGIFAANGWTELVWAAAAAVLLAVSLLPRLRRPDRTGAGQRHSERVERELVVNR